MSFGEAARGAVHHLDLDLVGGELVQRLGDGLQRALHVGLDDECELLDLSVLGHPGEQRVERQARGLRERPPSALLLRAEAGDLPGLRLVLDDLEGIARVRDVVEAHDLDGGRRAGLEDALAAVVEHRANWPTAEPAKKTSPTLRVPCWTRTVARVPRPTSRRASRTTPRAGPSTAAFGSRRSACRRIISSSASMPISFLAEISQETTSPPYSSTRTCYPTVNTSGSAKAARKSGSRRATIPSST